MKENKSNFYFGYPGNKRSENKLLEPYLNLDGIDKIIEPFCGTSSFSRFIYANYGDKYAYYSNDIDTGLITWLKDVQKDGCKKYFDYTNNLLKGLTREQHKNYIQCYKQNLNNPYYYFYYNKIYNYRRTLYPEKLANKTQDYTKYKQLDEFYKKCILSNLDYIEYLKQYKDDPAALVYFDPPYFNACNVFYGGIESVDSNMNIIDNTYIFGYISDYLKTAKCKIILVINHNSLLSELYKPFIKLVYNKTYSFSHTSLDNKKRRTRHMIITNY